MPRKYIRKSNRGSWSQEALKTALQRIKSKDLTIGKASIHFGIPKRTLRRYIARNSDVKLPLGPSSNLGDEVERKLALHIKTLQKMGFAPARWNIQRIAFKLAETLQIKTRFNVDNNAAGYHWFNSFLERNPTLSIRKAQGISINRMVGMNKKEVADYFSLLKSILIENNLFNQPGRIYNMDECGVQLNNCPQLVVAEKGSKNVYSATSAEKGETITVVACANAEGVFLPPFCIFKGVNLKEEYKDGLPPGSNIKMNRKSAYISSDLFMTWLKEHFMPRKPPGKVLLILDGHSSHMNDPSMLTFANNNDIIILCLPSHTTHFLQPLDRCFFRPLKHFFRIACNNFITTHPNRKINRLQFGELFSRAWQSAATLSTGESSFKATGIYPFNPSAILEEAFLIDAQTSVPSNSDNNNTNNDSPPTLSSDNENENPNDDEYQDLPSPNSPTLLLYNENQNIISSRLPNTNENQPPNLISTPFVDSTLNEPKTTPTKILKKISPLPMVQKNSIRKKQNAAELTDLKHIEDLKKKKKIKDSKPRSNQESNKNTRVKVGQKKSKTSDRKNSKRTLKPKNLNNEFNEFAESVAEPGCSGYNWRKCKVDENAAQAKEKVFDDRRRVIKTHALKSLLPKGPKNLNLDNSLSSNASVMINDDTQSSQSSWCESDIEEICAVCGEFGKAERWFRCRVCAEWAHKACTGFDRPEKYICDYCHQ